MKNIAVYDNVRSAARNVGISINALEKESGLSSGSICKWNTVSPSVNSLLKVATVLGVTVGDLLSGNPDQDQNTA